MLNKKPKVEIYSKPDCCLCDEAKAVLNEVQREIDFDLVEIDIRRDSQLFDTYKERIPIGFINGKTAFKYRIDKEKLRLQLTSIR